MRNLLASVTWNSEADGCLEQPFSGIQPSFAIGGDLIMSRVETLDDSKTMQREQTYEVKITLPYGEYYDAMLAPSLRFRLQCGARVIAQGMVREVIDQ